MSTITNRRITLAARPQGDPKTSDFATVDDPAPAPGEGEMLLRTIHLSLDPYMRGRMNDVKSYVPPVPIGHTMEGGAVSVVEESRHPGFSAGDVVFGYTGWQQYAISDGKGMRAVDPSIAPISTALGILGMPGSRATSGSSTSASRRRARPWWSPPPPERWGRSSARSRS